EPDVIIENSVTVPNVPKLISENFSNIDILPMYTPITHFTSTTSGFSNCVYTNSYNPSFIPTTSFTISQNTLIKDINNPPFSTNSLTSSSTSFNLEDSINLDQHSLLYKYLPWCPSFQNPPFHNNDPYNLWDDEFLQKTLMPRVWNEALNLKKTFSSFAINDSITSSNNLSVQKAVLCNMKSNNIFQ
ncbi:24506_t:CDS:1, partial [Racocetra persica]